MGWFDNLIGLFSPKKACEREAWRLQLQQLRGAGYDAADHGRLNANWQAYNESADLTDRVARDTIRARARDLERNSDLANEIILAFRRNVVGKGFTLQARTQSDELNSQVEALWRQWTKSRNCDVTGQQSLNQMLRMAVQRKKVDGGILFLKCYTKDGLLPFKLQALEVDELALSQSVPKYKDDRVVGGVEFNRYGKPTGYWVQQYSIDGWQTTEPEFHPAKDVIFYYSKRRPSQLREVSDFAPTISRIRDANEFITAVSVKERIAACLAVFIRKTVPTTGFGRSGQTAAAPKTTYDGKTLTPGMITEMNAGDDVQVVDPKSGSGDATTFLKMQQRLIGGGQGISYETAARDMSETTYSSARQASIEDEATFGEEIELLQDVMSEIQGVLAAFQVAVPAILSVVQSLVASFQAIITSIQGIFDGLITFVTGVFTGNWGQAWEGVKQIFGNAFNALVELAKAPINAVIALINGAIDGINSLTGGGISIPDWVPVVGGQTFSLKLNKIPALAHGGFTQGVSIAGEAGTEAVISFMPTVRSANINTWQQAGRMLGVNQQQAAAVAGAAQPAASASSVVVIPAAVQSLMQQYAGATQGEALAFADRQVEMATADPLPLALTGDGGNPGTDTEPTDGDDRPHSAPQTGGSSNGNGGAVYQYAPQFIFQGSANREDVEAANKMGMTEFRRMMEQYEKDNSRRRF